AEQEGKRRLAEEAIGHYEAALARNPREMAAEFGLARALNAAGRPEEALAHMRRAADYQPRHVFYREQLGIQLRRLGRDREALEVFRRNVEDQVATDVSTLNIRALERKLARENAAAGSAAAD
ncbi:MAG TPA: tetratricopeptide repeat protein, partial [Kiritimatiellia bacterium]|nr:tetratricopeptide repeat protein [Kiritimatiellia bacterium]